MVPVGDVEKKNPIIIACHVMKQNTQKNPPKKTKQSIFSHLMWKNMPSLNFDLLEDFLPWKY